MTVAKNLIGKYLPGGHRQQDLAQCHAAAYSPRRELRNLSYQAVNKTEKQ